MRFIKAIGEWFKARLYVNRVVVEAQLKPNVSFDEIMQSGGQYKLSPNDIVLIRCPVRLSEVAITNIRRSFINIMREAWGYSPVVVVLEEGLSYSVISPNASNLPIVDIGDLSNIPWPPYRATQGAGGAFNL